MNYYTKFTNLFTTFFQKEIDQKNSWDKSEIIKKLNESIIKASTLILDEYVKRKERKKNEKEIKI